MSVTSLAIQESLFTALNVTAVTDLASGIYYGQAPIDATYPLIVFQRVPGDVDRAFAENLIGERDRWWIKSYSDLESSNTQSPQELNETILSAAETAIGLSVGTSQRCVRVADLPELLETVNDRTIWMNGFQLEVYA